MTSRYKRNIGISKANLDIEMRNIVKKFSHHSRENIVQVIREKMNVAIDLAYLDELLTNKEPRK